MGRIFGIHFKTAQPNRFLKPVRFESNEVGFYGRDCEVFEEKEIPCKIGYKIGEENVNLIDLIQKIKVQYIMNTNTKGNRQKETDSRSEE